MTSFWLRIFIRRAQTGRTRGFVRSAATGRLHLKTARSGGAFIGCGNYPECRYTRPISVSGEEENGISPDGQVLGMDENGEPISLRTGRFGPYVQRGEATEEVPKPPRASLPKGWGPESDRRWKRR